MGDHLSQLSPPATSHNPSLLPRPCCPDPAACRESPSTCQGSADFLCQLSSAREQRRHCPRAPGSSPPEPAGASGALAAPCSCTGLCVSSLGEPKSELCPPPARCSPPSCGIQVPQRGHAEGNEIGKHAGGILQARMTAVPTESAQLGQGQVTLCQRAQPFRQRSENVAGGE